MKARRRSEVRLGRILLVLCVLAGLGLGILRFARWFSEDYVGGKVEASAQANMEEARRFFEEGKGAEARKLLRPIVARVKNGTILPKVYMLLAEIDKAEGDMESAMANLESAYSFSNSPEYPAAASAYARLLEEQGDLDDAVAIYREVRRVAPRRLRGPALTGLARSAERAGNMLDAQELYREALDVSEWEEKTWDEAVEALGVIDTRLIFSPEPTRESKTYVVETGDTLTRIGIELNTTQGLLTRANEITDPTRLREGDHLKYTPKDFRIVIDRAACRLYLLDHEGVFKRYSVGLGRGGHATTLGKYKIGNKQKNPTWYRPDGGVIGPGDAENELGSRWMPLVPDEEGLPGDLGIHGTNDPSSIGLYTSRGCPRLNEDAVIELYDLVVRSTPVFIVENYGGEESG